MLRIVALNFFEGYPRPTSYYIHQPSFASYENFISMSLRVHPPRTAHVTQLRDMLCVSWWSVRWHITRLPTPDKTGVRRIIMHMYIGLSYTRYIAPSSFSLAIMPSTSATLPPPCLVGGSTIVSFIRKSAYIKTHQ